MYIRVYIYIIRIYTYIYIHLYIYICIYGVWQSSHQRTPTSGGDLMVCNDLLTFGFACVRLALCNGIAVLELSGEAFWWGSTLNLEIAHFTSFYNFCFPFLDSKVWRFVTASWERDGSWTTAPLKEYPPAFCRGLATAFRSAVGTPLVVKHCACPKLFLSQCEHLFVQASSQHFGQDFAGWMYRLEFM